jgi:hypothetical protein
MMDVRSATQHDKKAMKARYNDERDASNAMEMQQTELPLTSFLSFRSLNWFVLSFQIDHQLEVVVSSF